MPRSKPWRGTTFKAQPVELDPRARREIAEYLGLAGLPDDVADGIAHALGAHQPEQWRGSTPRGDAARLRQLAKSLDRASIKMHAEMTGPYSLINDETAELLFNEAETLAAAMQSFRERLLTRAAILHAMAPIRPEHEALTLTVRVAPADLPELRGGARAGQRGEPARFRSRLPRRAGDRNKQSERTSGAAAGDVAGQGAATDPRLATDPWRAGISPTPFLTGSGRLPNRCQ